MRKTYRYDKKLGRMVEIKRGAEGNRNGPYIMGDIEPYQAVGPEQGKWITSRSQHREYLRKHGLIEVGNERKYFDGKPH
jgi:hypothetical protein